MAHKVLFALTNHQKLGDTGKTTGFNLLEVVHPLYELEKAGFEVTFVSPRGGEVFMDENTRDIAEPLNRDYLGRTSFQHRLANTIGPHNVITSDYSAIYFAGGLGAVWDFPGDLGLSRLALEIYEAGGILAAVSQGLSAFLSLHLSNGEALLNGKQVTGPSQAEQKALGLEDVLPFFIETELKQRGASYSCGSLWQRYYLQDGRLITGQNPASARGVGGVLVKLLRQKS